MRISQLLFVRFNLHQCDLEQYQDTFLISEQQIYVSFFLKGKAGRWIRHYHLKVPPPPMPTQPPRGGPRQRILPTPRGVNMIAWSLDNRFVLAAIMGNASFFYKFSCTYLWMYVSATI